MADLISELFGYLMLIIAALYTVLSFAALRRKRRENERALCTAQMVLMYIMLLMGYLIILFRTKDLTAVKIFAGSALFFLVYYPVCLSVYKTASAVILSDSIFLFSLGLMILTRLDPGRAVKQLLIGCAAFLLALVIPAAIRHFKFLARWAWFYALIGIGLLAVVWKLGSTTYGAQLSFSFGGVTLQPSELVKITFVFFTASMLRERHDFKRVLITTVLAAAHVLVLVASTDLGSGLVYFTTYLFMLLTATHKPVYLGAGIGAGAAASVAAYQLFDHVKVRVQMWIDPFSDYDRKGYQLAQSLFAISSGGWLGLGLCQGYPNTIPLARNDFIFAAICEELGVAFGICLILIYLGFLLQLLRVSSRLKDPFYRLLGVGFAVMLGVQTFLHIGGVTKMIPSTGITLPLLSYGGSSVLSTVIIIGIIQGLHGTLDSEEADARAAAAAEAFRKGGGREAG